MGVWTTDPKTGKSQWRDEFPDTPEGQKAAQADTDKRSAQQATSSTYNTSGAGGSSGGAGGGTQGDQGTNYGYSAEGGGGTAEDRTKNIYEFHPGEKLPQWMQRVFQQGTRDFGGDLAPSVDNPFGRTPYAKWFQNRYQDVVPANTMLNMLLTNSGGSEDMAPQIQGAMQNFMQGGPGRGFGTGTAGAQQNLGQLNDMLNRFTNGDESGLSANQVGMLGGLNDDPTAQAALFNAQIAGGLGANPLAAGYVSNLASGLADEYFDDPVGHSPATNGTYLQNLMQRMHMAQKR